MQSNVCSQSRLAWLSISVRVSTRASSSALSFLSSAFCSCVTRISRSFSSSSAYCSNALFTVSTRWLSFHGLEMKRKISERLMASSIAVWSAWPVSMMRCARGT
jgi:hypothetical protein